MLAKEWFSTAETAENAGDDVEATRAYACSYKMVAHPYTAFNLARVADRSGQSDLALKMFKAYLALKPDAKDTDEVKLKIKSIEDKIAAAQESPPEPTAEAIPEETPAPEPPRDVLSPPPVPKPADVVTKPAAPQPKPESSSYLVEWILGGAVVGALAGGIATNLIARAKMDTCRTEAANGTDLKKANAECNAAKPMAYTSYALFSVAAAAAAVDATLLILKYQASDDSPWEDEASYGFMLLPGGGGLTARGRF